MLITFRDHVMTAGESSPTQAFTARPPKLLFAFAVGVIIMNHLAPQPLVSLIGASLGLAPSMISLAATATLLGYAFGLFLLVPLADLVENRQLVGWMLGSAAVCSGVIVFSSSPPLILLALLGIGMGCSALQVLVPIAASVAPPEKRGQMIGDVMSGMMAGVLLSRPLASFLASIWGWRGFYIFSAASLLSLTALLMIALPRRYPTQNVRYVALLASLGHLIRTERVLQRQRSCSRLRDGCV